MFIPGLFALRYPPPIPCIARFYVCVFCVQPQNSLTGRTLLISAGISPPAGFPVLVLPADFTANLLAKLWLGGLLAITALTHWVTITNFMGFLPIPGFRIYPGTSTSLLCPLFFYTYAYQLLQQQMLFANLLHCIPLILSSFLYE